MYRITASPHFFEKLLSIVINCDGAIDGMKENMGSSNSSLDLINSNGSFSL